jgi:hypothetical protein
MENAKTSLKNYDHLLYCGNMGTISYKSNLKEEERQSKSIKL